MPIVGLLPASHPTTRSDRLGWTPTSYRTHSRDIETTILQLLDHRQTTHFQSGRAERRTINGGNPIREIVG